MSDRRHLWPKPIQFRCLDEVFPGGDQAAFRSELSSAIKEAFHDPPPADWFALCETYLQGKKLDSFVEIMHARYGFFRGLFLAFSLGALMLMIVVLTRFCTYAKRHRRRSIENLIVAFLFVVGAYLAYVRTNDFDRYYAQGTYRAFHVDYARGQHTVCDIF
jgi:hypothetical protein